MPGTAHVPVVVQIPAGRDGAIGDPGECDRPRGARGVGEVGGGTPLLGHTRGQRRGEPEDSVRGVRYRWAIASDALARPSASRLRRLGGNTADITADCRRRDRRRTELPAAATVCHDNPDIPGRDICRRRRVRARAETFQVRAGARVRQCPGSMRPPLPDAIDCRAFGVPGGYCGEGRSGRMWGRPLSALPFRMGRGRKGG